MRYVHEIFINKKSVGLYIIFSITNPNLRGNHPITCAVKPNPSNNSSKFAFSDCLACAFLGSPFVPTSAPTNPCPLCQAGAAELTHTVFLLATPPAGLVY